MDVSYTKIIKDPTLGNGLAARLDIDANEVLINISRPFLIVVEKEALDKVCSYCLTEPDTSSLRRCVGCKVAQYCTPACQKADWKSVHQQECSILKKLPRVPPTPVRGLMQLLLRHQHGNRPDPVWAGLESHIDELKQSKRWNEIILQAKAAVEFSKSPPDRMEIAMNLLCRMSTNAFRATLADDTPVGLCFEPTLALANHSCTPNAVVMFDERNVSLRTLDRIKEGEQIFISYVDPAQPRELRRGELQERYFFSCECDKCRNDDNPYQLFLRNPPAASHKLDLLYNTMSLRPRAESCIRILTPGLLSSVQIFHPRIQTLLDRSKTTQDRAECPTLLRQALSHLSPLTIHQLFAITPYPAVLNELYLYCLESAAYLSGLIILLFISQHCDPFTYRQPHHPTRIIRLFTIAKLLKHLASIPTPELLSPFPFLDEYSGHLIRNIDYVSTVQAVLIIVREQADKIHAKESRFVKDVEAELRDVEGVQKLRGNAGIELTRWMMQGDVAAEGKFMAEKLFADLRSLGGLIGLVVEEVKV